MEGDSHEMCCQDDASILPVLTDDLVRERHRGMRKDSATMNECIQTNVIY